MLQKFRGLIIIFSLFFALAIGVVTVQVMVAGTEEADLSGSTLSVNKNATIAGGSIEYTVVIHNSGGTAVQNVVMTNTLPSEVTYTSGSLSIDEQNGSTIAYGNTGNVITWTGNVESLGSISISYNVDVTDTVLIDDIIQNSVQITGAGEILNREAPFSVLGTQEIMLPIVFTPLPTPVLDAISGPTGSSNSWTATWSEPVTDVNAFQIQESHSLDFSNAVTYDLGDVTSNEFSPSASIENTYCYRVRAFIDELESDWSNIECTVGNYFDDMSNSSSGWSIRQQDTDDAENSSYYENGEFVIKIGGRWDYALASPLASAPKPPYALEGRISFDPTVDNLHAYGIVFGGNWNGQPCPNGDLSSCFTHYYRLLVIWYGPLDSLRVELKRIDYNDPTNNAGRGVTLDGFNDVSVGDSKGFNNWRIEVEPNGTIRVFLNGSEVLSAADATYVNDSYFGVLGASNEYLGAEPHVDWFRATKE